MTTTIELPDSIYEQVKAHAARRGKTVEVFLVEAIREKLAEEKDRGWRSVFGKADKEDVAAVQRIIDEEFSACYPQP